MASDPTRKQRVVRQPASTAAMGLFLAIALAGCCSPVPKPEKFFKPNMLDPYWTLRAFVYAVDTSHWEYAFERLTEESRAEFGNLTRFKAAVNFISVDLPMSGPEPVRVSIYELVSSALDRQNNKGDPVGPNGWQLRTILKARDSRGLIVAVHVDLFLRLDVDEIWRLDLQQTMAVLQSRRPRAAL